MHTFTTDRQMALYLSTSPARRAFKNLLGQANHQIVTALVGLDAIEKEIITSSPKKLHEELHAVWSPKNAVVSARRSRRLILDMALVRSVDALDAYIRRSNRQPFLIQSGATRSKIDSSGQSVYGKFSVLELDFQPKDKIPSALVALMISWRNRAAHMEASEKLKDCYKKIIRENKEAIKQRFRGLDGDVLLAGYNDEQSPAFKEVTSFINATHQYVNELERSQFQELDPERFLKELIWTGVSVDDPKGGARDYNRKRLLKSIWGKSLSSKKQSKKRSIERFLEHQGLSSTKPKDEEHAVVFDDSLLEELTSKTPTETFNWAKPPERESDR